MAAKRSDSSGVNCSSKMSSCWTNAPNLPKSSFPIYLSLQRTSPLNLEPLDRPRRYPSMFRKLVLPDPEAPMIASSCPGFAYPFKLKSMRLTFPSGDIVFCCGGNDVKGKWDGALLSPTLVLRPIVKPFSLSISDIVQEVG